MSVNISYGNQKTDGVLRTEHCPSNVGCRATVTDVKGNRVFPIDDDFQLTFKVYFH